MHETVSDGSVYFGHDSQTTASDGTVTNDFNTDETVKFPSAVALVWRWTGDKRFLDSMYDFTKRNMHVIDERYDVDHDGWPEGSGNVERPGMGPEKLDNGVYYMRGLYDLADMARAEHDSATATWATNLADRLRSQFEQTWWDPSVVPVRRLARQPGQQPGLPQELDRPGPDGGHADHRDAGHAGRRQPRSRRGGAGHARGLVLQRRSPREPRPLPHGVRWRC